MPKFRKNPVKRRNNHAPTAVHDSNKLAKSKLHQRTRKRAASRDGQHARPTPSPRQKRGPLQRNWRIPTAGRRQLRDETHALITICRRFQWQRPPSDKGHRSPIPRTWFPCHVELTKSVWRVGQAHNWQSRFWPKSAMTDSGVFLYRPPPPKLFDSTFERLFCAGGHCTEGWRRSRNTFTHPSELTSITDHPLRTIMTQLTGAQNTANEQNHLQQTTSPHAQAMWCLSTNGLSHNGWTNTKTENQNVNVVLSSEDENGLNERFHLSSLGHQFVS